MKTQIGFLALAIIVLTALISAGSASQAANTALRSVDESVLQNYQKIQESLAADSLKGISENAASISKTVQNDPEKRLPIMLSQQAEKLSKDRDLKAAREDFKDLSATLISYLEKANAKATGYQQNYCPMVKASWVQKGKKINNPYLGKSMPGCGETKRTF